MNHLKTTKQYVFTTAALMSVLMLPGCYTIGGMGKDLQHGGRAIQHAATIPQTTSPTGTNTTVRSSQNTQTVITRTPKHKRTRTHRHTSTTYHEENQ
jgi:predicted small secreted protein